MDEPIDRRTQDLADLNLLFWHLVRREAERNVRDMRVAAATFRLSARLLQRVTRLSESAVPLLAGGAVLHFELTSPDALYEALETIHSHQPTDKPPVDDSLHCHLTRRFLTICRERAEQLDAAAIIFRLPIGLIDLIHRSTLRQLEHVVGWTGLAYAAIDAPPLALLAEAAELGDPEGWASPTRVALGTVFDPSVLAVV